MSKYIHQSNPSYLCQIKYFWIACAQQNKKRPLEYHIVRCSDGSDRLTTLSTHFVACVPQIWPVQISQFLLSSPSSEFCENIDERQEKNIYIKQQYNQKRKKNRTGKKTIENIKTKFNAAIYCWTCTCTRHTRHNRGFLARLALLFLFVSISLNVILLLFFFSLFFPLFYLISFGFSSLFSFLNSSKTAVYEK